MWSVLNSKSKSWNLVERLCFPAPTASYTIKSFPEELILIPGGADGEKVPCLFLPFRHARFLFIYFHANAEDLGLCHTFCTIIRDLFQVHMLAVEYPGYGICPGHCDEAGMMANASAAVRFALDTLRWPCDGIKLFGRSIGTGPAVALAAQHDMAGLILVTPFLSIKRIFAAQVGALAGLMQDRFDNFELASKIESPTLIIHGQQDTLIPLAHSKMIYDALPAKKMMVCPAMMGHNTSLLANVGTFVLPMTQFFSLPDYTFEDIEVPSWVFPENTKEEEQEQLEDEENQWVCATSQWMGAGATPRKVMSEWRRGAGSCLGGGVGGASVGFPLPSAPSQPVVNGSGERRASPSSARDAGHGPPASTEPARDAGYSPSQSSTSPTSQPFLGSTKIPQKPVLPEQGSSTDASRGFKASRDYDFRTPPNTPRGAAGNSLPGIATLRSISRSGEQPPTLQGDPEVVEDCNLETALPPGSDLGETVDGSKVNISEDMLHAIENGISWLVDTNSDVSLLGQDEPKPDNNSGPGTLRGAPELRERMADRLRDSEAAADEPAAAKLTGRPPKEPEEDKVTQGDDSTTDLAERSGEIGLSDDEAQKYKL